MTDKTSARAIAKILADKHYSQGDPLGWFETLYATASGDSAIIPWADRGPNQHLLAWLKSHLLRTNGRVLVVGCGLGDDAEELSSRGMKVTAFDLSPTAIQWCLKRFPNSATQYVPADLLNPPVEWSGGFDFVLESYTLQAMPLDLRPQAAQSLARFLAPSGRLLVICRGREPEERLGELPWPLTREELTGLTQREGLKEEKFEDFLDDEKPPVRRFRAVYRKG